MRAQHASSVSLTGGKDKATRWPNVLQVMPPSCRAVFQALAQISKLGNVEEVEISLRELAEIANFSHEQTRRALRRLQAARLIAWVNRGRGRGRKSRFKILWRFYGQKVTPQGYTVTQSPEHGFSSDIEPLETSAEASSPLRTSPLNSPREEEHVALQSKDGPSGPSLPAGAEKIFRRLAAALRRTALFNVQALGLDPQGVGEVGDEVLEFAELEEHVVAALLVALWRQRPRWRNRAQLVTAIQVVMWRMWEGDTWCWEWWKARGVRAVYALVMQWVKQAFRFAEHLRLTPASPRRGLCPGWGSFQRGLAHGVLGVALAPSPGGTCWRWGDD